MQGEVSAGVADYVRVDSLEAAIATLAKGPRTILAGGTDVFPRLQDRPLSGAILDISVIAALGTVAFDGDYWRSGAAARAFDDFLSDGAVEERYVCHARSLSLLASQRGASSCTTAL